MKNNITSYFLRFADLINSKTSSLYKVLLCIAFMCALAWFAAIYVTINQGLGVWGINNQISWAFCITNFVFWVGIGHAGTLISAILFLFRQSWRKSLNRSAEVMTLIAIIIAGIFPLIHTGRPWFSTYWLFPYPNSMDLWVNFKSPLIWDFFAILTYFMVSLMFWYLGLIPDFAVLRNGIKSKKLSTFYKFFSFGWRGSSGEWSYYRRTYAIFAGIAAALVISVHSIVSFDFAVTNVAGWHVTIFPPYFVAGAIFSGCAFVAILLLLTQKLFKIKDIIKSEHIDKLMKVMLATSMMVTYSYAVEVSSLFINSNINDLRAFSGRIYTGYGLSLLFMVICNSIFPQLLWIKRFRNNNNAIVLISTGVLIGMWLERFIIVAGSLSTGYMPQNISSYSPTWVEMMLLVGSFGFFLLLYLVIIKFIPPVSLHESEYNQ